MHLKLRCKPEDDHKSYNKIIKILIRKYMTQNIEQLDWKNLK